MSDLPELSVKSSISVWAPPRDGQYKGPRLPETSRWIVQTDGAHYWVWLPTAPWSCDMGTCVCLVGTMACLAWIGVILISLPRLNQTSLATFFIVLAFILNAFLLYLFLWGACPLVLDLGPESYTCVVGWRWLAFSRRQGATRNLRAELVSPVFAANHQVVTHHVLQLREQGSRDEFHFWEPYWKCKHHSTDGDRFEIQCLAAVINHLVQEVTQTVRCDEEEACSSCGA